MNFSQRVYESRSEFEAAVLAGTSHLSGDEEKEERDSILKKMNDE